ncbi:MAG: M3 family oligoendopeptidase [Candidatus Moranbacteria bacterium]|jgi:oligoendopeptidase F|nr:M3 family oligoendopeptidase [Candidatus Moranbacteria bacterium]
MKKYPEWNLDDLYESINDPKISNDFERIKKEAQIFENKFRGNMDEKTSASEILERIKLYEKIKKESDKILTFAYLSFCTNNDNPEAGSFWQIQLSNNIAISNSLIFFDLELSKISDDKLKKLAQDKLLKNYKKYLQIIASWKPHRLSEKEEKIINEKKITGALAFSRFFEQEHSRKEYDFNYKGKKEKLNQSQILSKLYSSDRNERKKAVQILTDGLSDNLKMSTYVYNMIIQDKIVDDRYMNFTYPEESRHKENEIDRKSVDVMAQVISDNYSIVSKFYNHKKKLIKQKELFDCDRYAPVEKSKAKFSLQEAKKIILDSFGKFSPEFKNNAEDFFKNKWIDFTPRKGKRGGAFCHYATPDLHPYIFVNYDNNIENVLTLAHELGHGVNACLARKQSYLNFDWPLTIAETASVFAELLVFDSLKSKAKDKKEEISLHTTMIERIFSTVFRQNAMFLFERDVFSLAREKGELSEKEFSNIWRKRQKEMFGNSVELTENYDIWWSYIPHFINKPFYVYAYSFGELLSLSLYVMYKKDGNEFVEKYLNILESGGSKNPQELFSVLGIDFSKKEFWENGMRLIKDLVDEFESFS